jgi:tetratricopeptide (TPR) repeat protein
MGLVAVGGEGDLTRRELEEQPPNYEAYLRFTQGMALYVAEDTMPAAEAFLDAYAQDTTFTTALLYAALNYSNARRYSLEDSLLRILARSENRLSAYHRRWLEYRRAFLDGDRPRALRAIRLLAADAPRSKAVYNLGIEAWENGHLEEAVRALESLDPISGPMQGFQSYWGALANIHHLLGNHREALNAARQARAADPAALRPVGWELGALIALGRTGEVATRARALAHASIDDNSWSPAEALREAAEEARAHRHPALADSLWNLALVWYRSAERGTMHPRDRFGMAQTLYALGRFDDADVVARRIHEAAPSDIAAIGLLGTIAARRRDSTGVSRAMAVLERIDPRYQLGRPAYQRALIAAAAGEHERAIALLREARQQGRSYQMWVHREVDFEPLRETPEYTSLLRAIPRAAGRQ